MGKRKGVVAAMAVAARNAEKARIQEARAQQQAAQRSARALEAKRKAYERARVADEKERKRLYLEARIAEVDAMNETLEADIAILEGVLSSGLTEKAFFDFEGLKERPTRRVFEPGPLAQAEPVPDPPELPTLSFVAKLVPGAVTRRAKEKQLLDVEYAAAFADHQFRENQRIQQLAVAREAFETQRCIELEKLEERNREIESFRAAFEANDRDAITQYFQLVLVSSTYPESFPQKTKLSYSPDSRQLAIEYDLPTLDVVPTVSTYRYVKTKDEIASAVRPSVQRRNLYADVISQVTLRTVYEVFEADQADQIDTIVFNGHVTTVDPGTGQDIHPCLVTLRTSKDAFGAIDLGRVEPLACLKALSASVSKNPAELAPVRPVLDFSMVDPRFIEESDVLSGLDSRPNLMELTYGEFESLIANLFEKMGLETKLTRASRDGGVDCVAYNNDPVLGGKVVIQAKRYKNTVGVSAVRDLYGTLQNEGASKGILVTTSGYGKASYEFAQNKPIELFEGSNLLYLLSKYADIEARIEPPDNWKDPESDRAD